MTAVRLEPSGDIQARGGQRRMLLSTLWVVATLCYLYCDLLGFYDQVIIEQLQSGGAIDGITFTPTLLLGASVLMTIPISLVLLSRVLPQPAARWANVVGGTVMTLVQISTLFTGFTVYYLYFSVLEIALTAGIVWLAWTWRTTD